MKGLTHSERLTYARALEQSPQSEVMSKIGQFSDATIHNIAPSPQSPADTIHVSVFNMERGKYLPETIEFLKTCPQFSPCDIILANELDDGNERTGNKNVAREVAQALGMNYVFGLEFVELANEQDLKGFHGNAVFSRYPITWAKVLRLPEAYNWYFDRQKRIGGRHAIFAKIDIGGQEVGAVCIHLENRTDGKGRARQMQAIYEEAARVFPGLPIILGGDLNTNSFDGRDKDSIIHLSQTPSLLSERLIDLPEYEPLLKDAQAYGYTYHASNPHLLPTRRKPLPNGESLSLCLDWLLVHGLTTIDSRIISTEKKDFTFAAPESLLQQFGEKELSDHNAVWAACRIRQQIH